MFIIFVKDKIVVILVLFFLVSCGATVNIARDITTETRIRSSHSIFIAEPDKIKTVCIIIKNPTQYADFDKIKEIVKTKLSQKYTIVNNGDSADLVVYVNIKQFTKINHLVMENIDKYWQYSDSTDVVTMKDINQSSFSIADGSVNVTDNDRGGGGGGRGEISNPEAGILTKIVQNDFASGMSIGGVLGYWAYSASPIGAAIGAMIGGTMSYAAQTTTVPSVYMTTIDLQFSRKIDMFLQYNEKYVHRQDDNGMRWVNFTKPDNKIHYRNKLYITVRRSILGAQSAVEKTVSELSNAIINSI